MSSYPWSAGGSLYAADLNSGISFLFRHTNWNALNNKREIMSVSGAGINVLAEDNPYIFAESLTTGSAGDNNVGILTGSFTSFWDVGSNSFRTYYSGTATTYDNHDDTSPDYTKWLTGTVANGVNTGAYFWESGGYLQCYAVASNAAINGDATVRATSSGINFPNFSGLAHIQIAGSLYAGLSNDRGSSWAGLYALGSRIIYLARSASSGTSGFAGSIDLFLKSNGSVLIYNNGSYISQFAASSILIGGSCYAAGADPACNAYGKSWLNYETYVTGTTGYGTTVVETSGLIIANGNIAGVYVTPSYSASGTGSLTVDVSINGGSNWILTGQKINDYIDTSANTGSALRLQFNLVSTGSRIDTNEVVLKGYGVSVFA